MACGVPDDPIAAGDPAGGVGGDQAPIGAFVIARIVEGEHRGGAGVAGSRRVGGGLARRRARAGSGVAASCASMTGVCHDARRPIRAGPAHRRVRRRERSPWQPFSAPERARPVCRSDDRRCGSGRSDSAPGRHATGIRRARCAHPQRDRPRRGSPHAIRCRDRRPRRRRDRGTAGHRCRSGEGAVIQPTRPLLVAPAPRCFATGAAARCAAGACCAPPLPLPPAGVDPPARPASIRSRRRSAAGSNEPAPARRRRRVPVRPGR